MARRRLRDPRLDRAVSRHGARSGEDRALRRAREFAMKAIVAEILGLFVDDQGLALAILAIVAAALLLAFGFHAPAVAGAVLLLGCLGALVVSTLKGAS
jgi:hypothetical protein